jgi:hypothetical protein
MANLLNASTQMMCPHGGSVTIVTQNTQAKGGGDFLVRSSDTFIVAGCTLNVAGAPHPCMQVQWVQPDTASKASGDFTLSESSIGLCMAGDQAAQGTVQIVSTQAKVAGN